jgi:hypothetical protein
MFSFPEGPQPVSTAAPDLGDRARLIVEVPHWSAVVSVTDNDLRPVEGLSRLEPLTEGGEGASASVVLAGGVYSVEASLGGNSQSHWVVAAEGHETRVPMGMWDSLVLATSMPLASPIDGTPPDDPLVGTACELSQECSVGPAHEAGPATETRLFLFGRLAQGHAQAPAAWDLELLDEAGTTVARLADQAPRVEPAFWSSTLDLPRGYYVLRAREISHTQADPQGPGSPAEQGFYRCQPLYLCAGWESHVFLDCDESPRLATMSFNMARIGAGFRPDDEATIAAASVLAALGSDHARETVVGTAKMEQLLRGEMHNPWLGVLAGYALISAERGDEWSGLLEDVTRFLAHEIGDHPDVRALALDTEMKLPLDYPPMLRAGLRRVRSFVDTGGSSAIVADSALARVGHRLAADSAWTAWIERDEAVAPQPAGDAPEAAGDAPPAAAVPIPVLSQALSNSAPVYPLTSGEGASPALMRKSFAEQVAIIEEAENVLNTSDGGVKESVTVAAGASVGELLNVDAARVSEFAGTDRKTVEEGFKHLAEPLGQIDQLDEDSTRTMQHVLTTIFDLKRCAAIADAAANDGSGDTAPFFTPIEDHVETLRQEARRLRTLSSRNKRPSRKELAEAEALAAKLEQQAERLASHAHLVIVTDEDGQLLFGNKLLHDRLQQRLDPQDVLERLQRGLGGSSAGHFQVPARELSPTSPEGLAGTTVDVDRTVVRDQNEAVQAYIYLLRNSHAKNLGAKVARALDSMLPVMKLHAATALYGEADPSDSLAALRRLTTELDAMLG